MRLAYYPGCTLKTTAKSFEDSALKSLSLLDIELEEIPRWNCCGTVYSLASDNIMFQLAPIRNLIRVLEMGEHRVIVLCSMCYNTLKRANLLVRRDKETLDKINEFAYLEETKYDGSVEVVHLLEILKEIPDKIKEKVKSPLEGLKVAPYYGCLLVRPKEAAIDDAENPTIMNPIIESLGAEPVYFPYSVECCGSYQTVSNKELVVQRTYEIVSSAYNNHAGLILTSCPLCQFNLDRRQKEVMEAHPDFHPLPVLYFTQLMAYGFGLSEDATRFDLNYIDPKGVLK